MYQSELFAKVNREAPSEEKSINAILLQRAGFIYKLSAGIYGFLPLGFKVLKKIEGIIREEMNKIGGQELVLPALHPKDLWLKTGRWNTMDDLYKLKEQKKEFALGPTHEEIITPLARNFIRSEKDLPLYLYQIQLKFRKEARAKSGLLRTKEFLMKDLYSFHKDENDLDEYYEKIKEAYFRIFERVGIKKDKLYLTYASGGTFSKYSHEFQVLTEAGEDTIYICKKCGVAINKEIKEETPVCPNCGGNDFGVRKAIEVGNIFKLKDKFSKVFGLHFVDKQGNKKLVQMGCYGIGLGRLMGTIVELNYDSKGIIWPKTLSPFQAHIIPIKSGHHKEIDKKIEKVSQKLYSELESEGLEVLYDDREHKSPGEKFAEADLIGIPYRLVLSKKTIEKDSIEIKERGKEKPAIRKIKEASKLIIAGYSNKI